VIDKFRTLKRLRLLGSQHLHHRLAAKHSEQASWLKTPEAPTSVRTGVMRAKASLCTLLLGVWGALFNGLPTADVVSAPLSTVGSTAFSSRSPTPASTASPLRYHRQLSRP
jgi:hypothetical protein